ncbi:MAG: RNA polymerase sigma factor [Chloroflexi bacterium]|nr:RNA polymerase sigma factor [Chloroflexota bacterium]MCI0578021.1 RNA polymerase sigma factor [Chloroflexota bacterium]MCI0644765.1 RNA polymerase sigma factor [Chloroflexota bacterium]MCI0728670.1 RNA polymerase sigma factor [Chloroflexota bacterium]
MDLKKEHVEAALARNWPALVGKLGKEKARPAEQLVVTNYERGRVEHFVSGRSDVDFLLDEYIWRVADNYAHLNAYVVAIQIQQSDAVWTPLYGKLQRFVYLYLRKQNFYPGDQTFELVKEYAAEAGLVLISAYFPYDTEFDAWAYRLVENVCRRQMRKARKKKAIPDELLVSLEGPLALQAHTGRAEARSRDLRHDLLNAIGQIASGVRQKVLILRYFEGFSPKEIAAELDKSVGAVHTLHCKAIEELASIWRERDFFARVKTADVTIETPLGGRTAK